MMEVLMSTHHHMESRMNIHRNARLTPKGRAHLIKMIQAHGLKEVSKSVGISNRRARIWMQRFLKGGASALTDRSSRLLRAASPSAYPADIAKRVVRFRKNHRMIYVQIAERVGISPATVPESVSATM